MFYWPGTVSMEKPGQTGEQFVGRREDLAVILPKWFDKKPIMLKGVTLTNIGNIYYARGDYDTALRYLERSLKISEQIGDIAGEAITCFNMAKIFAQTGKIDKAIPLVERTVEIDRLTQHPDLESDMRFLMELRRKKSG